MPCPTGGASSIDHPCETLGNCRLTSPIRHWLQQSSHLPRTAAARIGGTSDLSGRVRLERCASRGVLLVVHRRSIHSASGSATPACYDRQNALGVAGWY